MVRVMKPGNSTSSGPALGFVASIHGVEKTDETGRLCRIVPIRKNLAIHRLN
jgi:hypothetical protein